MPTRRVSLDEEKILEVAQSIFIKDGSAGLSARRLAAELGVSQMAVYRYFGSFGELKGALVDRLIRERLPFEDSDGPWELWAEEVFGLLWTLLCAHEDLFALLVESAYVSESTMLVLERTLARLQRAGFTVDQAVVAFQALVGYTIGAAGMVHMAVKQITVFTSLTDGGGIDELLSKRFRALEGNFPQVQAHANALANFATHERFVDGLRAVIRGLNHRA